MEDRLLPNSDANTYLGHLDFGTHMHSVQDTYSPVQLMTGKTISSKNGMLSFSVDTSMYGVAGFSKKALIARCVSRLFFYGGISKSIG